MITMYFCRIMVRIYLSLEQSLYTILITGKQHNAFLCNGVDYLFNIVTAHHNICVYSVPYFPAIKRTSIRSSKKM